MIAVQKGSVSMGLLCWLQEMFSHNDHGHGGGHGHGHGHGHHDSHHTPHHHHHYDPCCNCHACHAETERRRHHGEHCGGMTPSELRHYADMYDQELQRKYMQKLQDIGRQQTIRIINSDSTELVKK